MAISATIGIADAAKDTQVAVTGTTYAALSSATPALANQFATLISANRDEYASNNWAVHNTLFEWPLSLPTAATITGAVLRIYVVAKSDVDARSITADWVTPTFTGSDFSLTPQTNAHSGTPIASITTGGTFDFTLSNADTNIPLSGTRGLRLHVSGSTPTGQNWIQFAAYDHATFPEPQLIVTYVLPTAKVASIASSSGYSGTYTDARTDDANWLLGV